MERSSNVSIFQQLVKAIQDNGDNISLVEGWSGASVSFSDMLQHSSSIAKGLQRAGVTVGDYVVFCCEKSILSFQALAGVLLSGATPVLVPTPYADSIDRLTDGHTVKVVLHDPLQAVMVTESISRMTPLPVLVATMDTEDPTMASLLKATPHELEEYHLEDPSAHVAVVLFSSGTTGPPKAIPITKLPRVLNKSVEGPILVTITFHMISVFGSFVRSIYENFPLILTGKKDPINNLRLIEKYKVKTWLESPGLLNRYIREACPHNFDISSLQLIFLVGEIVMSGMVSQLFNQVLRGHDVKIFVPYGSTEVGCVAKLFQPSSQPLALGDCGTLCPGVQLKERLLGVVDTAGSTVPAGVMGEIRVKSPNITPGYWSHNQPDLKEGFDEEGYFIIGDVGFLDDSGHLFIKGRVRDVVNYKGFKFWPAEVEDLLQSHPDVVAAAVVGKPHPVDVQHPTAFIVLRPGVSVAPERIIAFVDGKLGSHMRLRGGIRFLDTMPRNASGKIERVKLLNLVSS